MNSQEPTENIGVATVKRILDRYLLWVVLYICISIFSLYLFPNVFTFVPILLLGAFAYMAQFNMAKHQFMRDFGSAIGFTYNASADLKTITGKLSKLGQNEYISDVLTGTYKNTPIRIFNLFFMHRSGNYSTLENYTVLEITLAGRVPDICLYPRNESKSAAHFELINDESIELEGDFNAYFSLRVPKGSEQEAYEIFTPDVMAILIDKGQNINFELCDNKLYMYLIKVIASSDALESMLELSVYLSDFFEKNTKFIYTQPERPGSL